MRTWILSLAVAAVMVAGCGGSKDSGGGTTEPERTSQTSGGGVKDVSNATLVCAVLKDKIPDKSKALHSDYNGKRYYFCCPMCKPKFDKDPAKYSKDAPVGSYESL